MLVEQRWPNGKITSTIVDTSAAPLEGAGARLAWKRPISRALRLSRMSNSIYKLQPTLNPDYAEVIWRADILGEPRVGATLNNVTVSDSSRSPSAQETARGNVSDLVPSMASSTMESVTACSGF